MIKTHQGMIIYLFTDTSVALSDLDGLLHINQWFHIKL